MGVLELMFSEKQEVNNEEDWDERAGGVVSCFSFAG